MESACWFDEKEGVIVQEYHGDLHYDEVKRLLDKTRALVGELQQQGKPIFILVDARDIQTQDSGARKASTDFMQEIPFQKVAIFGMSAFIRQVSNFVLKAVHKEQIVHQFNTKEDALAWLHETN